MQADNLLGRLLSSLLESLELPLARFSSTVTGKSRLVYVPHAVLNFLLTILTLP